MGALDGQVQVPVMHCAPVSHTLAQPPQWLGSDCSFTHWPLQTLDIVDGQRQSEPEQISPPAVLQVVPHAPQLDASVVRSVQKVGVPVAGHSSDISDGHWRRQVPAAHTIPLAQALPHAPQLATSVVRSMHMVAPVHVVLGKQGSRQTPLVHLSGAVQILPQVPQLSSSVFRLTQTPLQSV